jgi:hypothetical protein
MRCPKCNADVEANALACPQCDALTPRGRRTMRAGARGPAADRAKAALEEALGRLLGGAGLRGARPARGAALRPWQAGLVLALALPLIAYGAYELALYVTFARAANTDAPEYRAMALVKDAPSAEEGQTVADLVAETERERLAAGAVKEIEGWKLTPEAPPSRWLVVYSYEDKDPRVGSREARWRADLDAARAEPLNDWAKALTKVP